MLKISRLADYGTVIMHYLADERSVRKSANSIANGTNIALPTASKVLKLLNDAALVTSTRGAMGGYQLARAPHDITLADIIMAVDGRPAVTQCCSTHVQCEQSSDCGLRVNWQTINQRIINMLSTVSLDAMRQPLPVEVPIHFYPHKRN